MACGRVECCLSAEGGPLCTGERRVMLFAGFVAVDFRLIKLILCFSPYSVVVMPAKRMSAYILKQKK